MQKLLTAALAVSLGLSAASPALAAEAADARLARAEAGRLYRVGLLLFRGED